MAMIDSKSCICVNSELDLFGVPPTQTSVKHGTTVEYHPVAALIDSSPIEFNVPGSGEDYVDLANSFLHVTAKITNGDGTDLAPGTAVGPANLFLHSLFSQIDMYLSDKLITSSVNTYAYRAYLETLLSYGKGAKNTQLTASLWYKDIAGRMEDAAIDDAGANTGFKTRARIASESNLIDMLGRIHGDLFFQEKLLLNGIGMRIRLVRSKDEFVLVTGERDARYKAKIVEAVLLIRKVCILPAVALAHAKALEKANAKYPIRRVECKTFSIPRGNLDVSQENVFLGQVPSRLVLGIVDNDAFNGTYAKNPFNFKHYRLMQLTLQLDGQEQPVKPLQLNFATGKIARGYMSLFQGTGKAFKDEDIDVSREDYEYGYTLFCFDLTPDLGENDHFSLIKSGSVRVNLTFAEPLPQTVNVIVYAEFQNVLEIDRNRNVFYDFAA